MASSASRGGTVGRSRRVAATLVRSWRKSGLSQRAFAEKEGIPPGTLAWWVYRSRSKKGKANPRGPKRPRFVEVRMPSPPEALEVILPGGVGLRVPAGFDRELLGFILGELVGGGRHGC